MTAGLVYMFVNNKICRTATGFLFLIQKKIFTATAEALVAVVTIVSHRYCNCSAYKYLEKFMKYVTYSEGLICVLNINAHLKLCKTLATGTIIRYDRKSRYINTKCYLKYYT